MNTALVCLVVIAAAAAYPEVRERRSLLGAGLLGSPLAGVWGGHAVAIAAPGLLAAPGIWGGGAAIAAPAVWGGHAAIAAPAVLAAGVPGGAVAGPSVVAGPSGVIKSSGAVAGPALGLGGHGALLHG